MNLISDKKYAAVMLVLSAVYSASAYSLDADFDPTHEKYYPFVLSVSMLALSAALLVWPSGHTSTWPDIKRLQKIGLVFCAILVYSLVLQKIGFLICASLLMGICMWVFGAPPRWIAPIALFVALVFFIVFDRLLGLALPAGLFRFL